MAHYVDGFIVPVPKKKLKDYLKMAKTASRVWKKYGALEYYEAAADDVKVGKVTSFPRSVKRKGNETVFFSWIIYKSRAHRDSVLKKVMKDPIFKDMDMDDMPFDGMRMIYGGFKIMVAA